MKPVFQRLWCVAMLTAQADYRSVQVDSLNLGAPYLGAAGQSNRVVGHEVIQ
jgi:hypothetical protein